MCPESIIEPQAVQPIFNGSPHLDAKNDYERQEDAQQLRELTLGSQLREQGRRFARLEERLLKEVAHLRNEVLSRMDALEKHVQTEMDLFSSRLSQESRDRQSSEKTLSQDLQQTRSQLGKDIDQLREAQLRSEREQRHALLESSRSFSTALQQMHDEIIGDLSIEISSLEETKLSRSSLAAMLSQGIMQLNTSSEGGRRIER